MLWDLRFRLHKVRCQCADGPEMKDVLVEGIQVIDFKL